jgi:site-specific recombinase XerD
MIPSLLLTPGLDNFSSLNGECQELTPMTPLRKRMLEDMQLRNLSLRTQKKYLFEVARFAQHFNRSPELLGPEEIRTYLLYLSQERRLSPSSVAIATAALRFVYTKTLRRGWNVDEVLPMPQKPKTLPVILSPEEVAHFLSCVLEPTARVVLTVCYAAGLRVSEAVALRVSDIDSKRMTIRVSGGKGAKDRDVMLSTHLLTTLRDWYRFARPTTGWLFPGQDARNHITPDAIREAARFARQRSGIAKPISPHALRHAFSVHLLEQGADVRTLQLLLGHRSLVTTSKYLHLDTSKVCATPSPFDRLPPQSTKQPSPPPQS